MVMEDYVGTAGSEQETVGSIRFENTSKKPQFKEASIYIRTLESSACPTTISWHVPRNLGMAGNGPLVPGDKNPESPRITLFLL